MELFVIGAVIAVLLIRERIQRYRADEYARKYLQAMKTREEKTKERER